MYLVFDIESKKIFDEVEDRDPAKLGVSYMAYYRSDTGSIEGLFDQDVPKFKALMDNAELIIGYNIIDFDFPVLKGYFDFDIKRYHLCDLYQIISKKHGIYLKLDNITQATLGAGKIAHGLDAIRFWREGNLDKLKEYCDMDVQLTKEVYEYIKTNKCFYYVDGLGERRKLDLDLDQELAGRSSSDSAVQDNGGFGLF